MACPEFVEGLVVKETVRVFPEFGKIFVTVFHALEGRDGSPSRPQASTG
jgi:hypothetical protein